MDGESRFLLYITQVVVGFIGGALWFLFSQSQKNKEALHQYKTHVAEQYAKKEDVKEGFKDVSQRLDKLFEAVNKDRK